MMLNQHSLEMRLNLPTTQLELFDDVGNFSKRCVSLCGMQVACAITRKVVLSTTQLRLHHRLCSIRSSVILEGLY